MNGTFRAKRIGAAAIAVAVALIVGASPAGASAQDLCGASAGTSTSEVTVCGNEVLNLNDQNGQRLSVDRIARATAALKYMCDQRGKISTMATGKWVTNTTKSEVKSCTCGSNDKSWTAKVTAVGLHTSGDKWVDLIWRISPGGSGKWNSGFANFVGPTTTYANLPLQSGTMGMGNYVETVGTYTQNGKIQEQVMGSAG